MALYFRVTDGVRTVDLAGGDAHCTRFGLDVPPAGEATATDSHEIEWYGGNLRVAINRGKLNSLFDQARRWQTSGQGPRVFVEVMLDGQDVYRSEVVDGVFQPTPESVNYEKALGIQSGRLTIVRRNWWEGAERTAALSSPNTAKRMYNNGDFTGSGDTRKVNYVDVDGSSIEGELEAPVRLTFAVSGLGGVEPTAAITLARSLARLEYAAQETTWWENGGMLWGDNASADFTAGDYQTITGLTEAMDLGLVNVGNYINQFGPDAGAYRLYTFMRVETAGQYQLRPFFIDGSSIIQYGKEFYVDFDGTAWDFVDCGTMDLPGPFSGARALDATVRFGLAITPVLGKVIGMDWAHFVRVDGYRKYFLTTGTTGFEDDQLDGSATYYLDGAYRGGAVGAIGRADSLSLVPGMWHRFYLHADLNVDMGVAVPKGAYMVPTITYRPRFACVPDRSL